MKNTIARKREAVFVQAEDMVDGLIRYGVDLGVVLVTESLLHSRILAAEATGRGYDEQVAARSLAFAAQTEADQEGRKFLRIVRNLLALRFGEFYSPAWAPTGFPNNSTAIPGTMGERQTLLRSLQNYFANHPEHEQASMGVTAVQAGIRFNASSDARSAVNNANDMVESSKIARDNALEELRRKMRGLIDELGQLMADDDSRWYSFGLNPPAAPDTPEVVEELVLSHGGTGIVLASWINPPRAERYRVLKQIVGVDAEPVAVETVYDTQFTFTGLTAGQTLRVQIVAANEAGVAGPSETVEIVVL